MTTKMQQIKKTKSVQMDGNEKMVMLSVPGDKDRADTLIIPMKVVFQVKRGLESYTQRFYRKHIK
jgi:hypothetical protein